MSDEQTQPQCGHDVRYIVQADEGTAFCVLCEFFDQRKRTEQAITELDRAERMIVREYTREENLFNILEKIRKSGAA